VSADVRALVAQAAARYGVDAGTLLRIAEIESGFNPAARNPRSSAGGVFQFIDGTARQYGLQDRFDPAQASDAAARLLRDNREHLRRVLGRDPDGAELYLAHQQGAGGAGKILANPNSLIAGTISPAAAKLNAGTPGMTNAQFAAQWRTRFGGAPGAAPAAPTAPAAPGVPQPPAIPPHLLAAITPQRQSAPLADLYAPPDDLGPSMMQTAQERAARGVKRRRALLG
jgi:hypothetical protein